MIYKFRVILDAEDDVFRDLEIENSNSLEDLHNIITQAFGFEGGEMASFYLSDNQWNQGEEIPLFSMDDSDSSGLMSTTFLKDIISEDQPNLIYVYDFFNMWTFFVELADIDAPENGKLYPNLLYAHGILPDSPPEKNFESETDESGDFDIFNSDEDVEGYDGLGFDENWN